jgi:hypothetical protein
MSTQVRMDRNHATHLAQRRTPLRLGGLVLVNGPGWFSVSVDSQDPEPVYLAFLDSAEAASPDALDRLEAMIRARRRSG